MLITKEQRMSVHFEGERDIQMLKAVVRLIGKTSKRDRMKMGLSGTESDLCSDFHTLLFDDFDV